MADILKFKGMAGNSTLYTVPTGKRAKVILTPSITGYAGFYSASENNLKYLDTDFYIGSGSIFNIGGFYLQGVSSFTTIYYNLYGGMSYIADMYLNKSTYEDSSKIVNANGDVFYGLCVRNFPKEHLLTEGETVTINGSGSYGFCGYNFMVIEEDV